jgi:hypothetical protein
MFMFECVLFISVVVLVFIVVVVFAVVIVFVGIAHVVVSIMVKVLHFCVYSLGVRACG